MPRRTLGVVVSANGYGHIRRQLLIASVLLTRDTQLRVVVGITEGQHKRFYTELSRIGSRLTIKSGLTENSPRWHHDEKVYTDLNLCGWEDEFMNCEDLYEADFLLSDNLSGVLAYRPDAWLSGSFLWSDVLEVHATTNEACARFTARERELLRQHHPPMIANQYLVTPGVSQRTQVVEVGWMIEEPLIAPKWMRSVVLIHGGGTRILDATVMRIKSVLDDAGIQTVTDHEKDPNRFDYEEESWSRIGLVICRPGVGTVTECVKWRIPILTIPDPTNNEAQHVIDTLVSLGLARSIVDNQMTTEAALVQEVRSMFHFDVNRFEDMRRSGIHDAVNWILTAMDSAGAE